MDELGSLVGFQALEYNPVLPDGWADIATFAQLEPKISGVGTALFPVTKSHAKKSNIAVINANIRADNTGGIAYYEKMGFRTYSVNERVPLNDGSLVDRVLKRFLIE